MRNLIIYAAALAVLGGVLWELRSLAPLFGGEHGLVLAIFLAAAAAIVVLLGARD